MSIRLPELYGTPVLETERLVLRVPERSDFPAYLSYVQSDRTAFVGGPKPDQVAFERFAGMIGQWLLRGYGRFTIVETTSGAAIGHTGPMHYDDTVPPEVTWTLWTSQAEGRGLAFEAALAVNDWLFDDLGWQEVIAEVHEGNLRSRATAERLGGQLLRGLPKARMKNGVVYRFSPETMKGRRSV